MIRKRLEAFYRRSKRSSECVLLHNENMYASVPIGHSVKVKKEYNNIKVVLESLQYHAHRWLICVDLKMINVFLGQQGGHTKYLCFLCHWDSRATAEHGLKRKWPLKQILTPGEKNVINEPLVNRNKFVFPLLCIKLGVMKQVVKVLDSKVCKSS